MRQKSIKKVNCHCECIAYLRLNKKGMTCHKTIVIPDRREESHKCCREYCYFAISHTGFDITVGVKDRSLNI